MSLFSKTAGSMPSDAARFLIRLSAACALSRITSPSWPVRIRLPLPGALAASMNRMSPPTGVQASPVATPGTLVRMAASFSNLGWPMISTRSAGLDAHLSARRLGDAHRDMPEHLADLAFERAHARLAGVAMDDLVQRLVVDARLSRRQAVRLKLPRHQIAPGDLQLLRARVARKRDDLHAVQKRAGDGFEHIRGGDEGDARQIERHAQISVAEGRILLRIEHFEHGGGGIALDAARPSCRSRRASSRSCARRPS